MLMNTWFSSNALSPDKGLGAFEPKAEKASKGGGPSGWLCQRRGREWPSLFIHNFFSLGVAQPSPKAPRLHRGISVQERRVPRIPSLCLLSLGGLPLKTKGEAFE